MKVLTRLLGLAPIAPEDVRTANLQGAYTLAFHHTAGIVDNTQRHPWQSKAHRTRYPRAFQWIRSDHSRLGHTVAFEDSLASSRLEGLESLPPERGRSGYEHTHPGTRLRREVCVVEQTDIVRGYPHENASSRERIHHGSGFEALVKQNSTGLQQSAVHGHEEPVYVIHGQDVEQNVLPLPAPQRPKRLRIREKIAMAEHRALGAPRGS